MNTIEVFTAQKMDTQFGALGLLDHDSVLVDGSGAETSGRVGGVVKDATRSLNDSIFLQWRHQLAEIFYFILNSDLQSEIGVAFQAILSNFNWKWSKMNQDEKVVFKQIE